MDFNKGFIHISLITARSRLQISFLIKSLSFCYYPIFKLSCSSTFNSQSIAALEAKIYNSKFQASNTDLT